MAASSHTVSPDDVQSPDVFVNISVQSNITCVALRYRQTYSIKRSGQSSYLHELLQDYQPTYSLRSASPDLLATASHAFRHSATTTWNSIPFSIRNCDTIIAFKRRLTTFLFNQAFAI